MVDILIENANIVTVDKNFTCIKDGAIAVEGRRIVAVGDTESIKGKYKADKIIDATGMLVMPGLVCPYNYMFQWLIRCAVFEPFAFTGDFLAQVYWPKFEDTVTPEVAYTGALSMSTEMLKNGVTCTADKLSGPNAIPEGLDEVARAVQETGIRAVVSFEASERVSEENGRLGMMTNYNFVKKWNKIPETRIRGRMCVHAPSSSSPDYFKWCRKLADETKSGIQMNIAQMRSEVECVKEWFGYDGSVYFLNDIDFLGPDVLFGHGIHLTRGEIDILQRNGCSLACDIKHNMVHAQGVPPVVEFLRRGINVGMGLDQYAGVDIFAMMDILQCALRVHHLNPGVIDETTLIKMATINGARALLLEKEIGSIEVGKKADIILIKPPWNFVINENILALLVNFVRGCHVKTVLVDGEVVVEDGKIKTVDEEEVLRKETEIFPKRKKAINEAPVAPPWVLPTLPKKS
jgi:5-methylthioadenosine/S-adenosylhomocysteine deaminase